MLTALPPGTWRSLEQVSCECKLLAGLSIDQELNVQAAAVGSRRPSGADGWEPALGLAWLTRMSANLLRALPGANSELRGQCCLW